MKVDSSTPPAMPEIPLPKLSGVCERTDASTMLTHAKAPGNDSQALFSLYMNDAHFFFVFSLYKQETVMFLSRLAYKSEFLSKFAYTMASPQ